MKEAVMKAELAILFLLKYASSVALHKINSENVTYASEFKVHMTSHFTVVLNCYKHSHYVSDYWVSHLQENESMHCMTLDKLALL